MNTNKRTISIGKLRTASLAYLSGFFGRVVTRSEMITLQEEAQKAGVKRVSSNTWRLVVRYDHTVDETTKVRDTFARDAMEIAVDQLLSNIRWRYGRQCKLFMQGYLDGLPNHLSLFDALEMMKHVAPSYFKWRND